MIIRDYYRALFYYSNLIYYDVFFGTVGRVGIHVYYLLNDVHTAFHLAKHSILSVEERSAPTVV